MIELQQDNKKVQFTGKEYLEYCKWKEKTDAAHSAKRAKWFRNVRIHFWKHKKIYISASVLFGLIALGWIIYDAIFFTPPVFDHPAIIIYMLAIGIMVGWSVHGVGFFIVRVK